MESRPECIVCAESHSALSLGPSLLLFLFCVIFVLWAMSGGVQRLLLTVLRSGLGGLYEISG